MVSDFFYGLRSGWRSCRRSPGFTLLAVVILATGIAASTVMFTLVQAVLIRDLPFTEPGRLVWMYNQRTERDRAPISLPDFEDYRRDASTLAGLAVFTNWTANLTGSGTPERLEGVRVSGNFFELLGTSAMLGRPLRPDDEHTDARVALLTHALWVRRFGADAAIVGRGVLLNGATYTVVGVLPPRFLFPFREAEVAVPVSLESDPRRSDRGANFLRVLARVAPGVTVEQASRDLNSIAQRLQKSYPIDNARKTGISLYPLHAEIVRDYRAMLWTLFASVGVLLLVGCVNLANLLLVRAAGRQTEFAVRTSLGASRGSVARQLLGETTLLAALGGAFGLALAYVGTAAWRVWGPADFPQMATVALDSEVVLFAIAVSSITAVACGVAPAWFASREAVQSTLLATRTTTVSRNQRALQRAFVCAQIAAATVLLIGTLLMARGFARLEGVPAGFQPSQALSVQLSLPSGTYGNRKALAGFFEAVRDRLRSIPDIESAGAVSLLPLSGLLSTADIALLDRPAPPPDEVPQAHLRIATAEYFAAAGIPVLEGRSFDNHDIEDGRPVAIVSRSFANRHWPRKSAVGQSVRIIQTTESPALEIVGVVSDVKQFALEGPVTADLYVPLHQMPAFQVALIAARMNWVIRGRGDIAPGVQAVRAAISQIDPNVAVSGARTLESLWFTSLGSRRANVRILETFGNVALVLCALGVYGVTTFAVRTRRREIAIRAVLGARSRALRAAMLRRELAPVFVGVGIGLVVTAVAAPRLFAGVFSISPRDAVTYVVAAATLLATAAVAAYLPIHRAGATDPAKVLASS
ncbi:MAG TPA: ABC transporter permease [Vicinamibacterales bacterium]